jgi:predicted DNA-binding transcriptional regulator AlpA
MKDLNPDPLLTEAEAAAYVSYRPRTLASWRRTGRGPRFVAVSKTSVRYRRSDLDAWIKSRVRLSTSDDGEADRR